MKYQLSDTSALVLLWVGTDFYQSAPANDYLSQLDLSPGQTLHEACNQVWPHYAEVIKNRKYGVLRLSADFLAPSALRPCSQVIIAGAGLDAMGIELAYLYPHTHIYEIDNHPQHIHQKQALAPPTPNLHFLLGDLQQPHSVTQALQSTQSYRPTDPTLLLLEGITYYISAAALANFTRALRPDAVVANFYLPDTASSPEAVAIGTKVFRDLMGSALGTDSDITRYTATTLADTLQMRLLLDMPIRRLELGRLGKNRFFSDPQFQWTGMASYERDWQYSADRFGSLRQSVV